MKKIDSLKEYYIGNRALYLNFLGDVYESDFHKQFIVDKNNITSANISLISLIMLSIKEEIVENVGNLNYESKIFLSALEDTVSFIATEKDNFYYLDNVKFDKKEDIVALIRNKLAHGKFIINYKKNFIILNHENNEIKIDIEKFACFIISALRAYFKDIKTNEYIHDFCSYDKVLTNRETPIKTLSEIKNIARNIKHYTFKIISNDGNVPQICINVLDDFINDYKYYINTKEFYKLYNNLKTFFENYNCKLEMISKKVTKEEIHEKIINYATYLINENNDLTYEEQIYVIVQESINYINPSYKKINQLRSILKILNILEAIKTLNTSDTKKIYDYFTKKDVDGMYINFREIGIVLINLFNSLFMYGFDEMYKLNGGYKLDRKDEFDFGTLNLDNIKPIVDGIDYQPLIKAKNNYKSLKDDYDEVTNLINNKNNHLSKIKGDEVAKTKITNKLKDLSIELNDLELKLEDSKNNFLTIAKDYSSNRKYFKNFAIINGIRNSIAHGHYEIIGANNLEDSKIIFSDIYKNNLTFKLEVDFHEFSTMLENNYQILFNYLDDKEKKNKSILKLWKKV